MQRSLGVTPHMTRAMANSPAVLKGYLELSGALATGTLPLATRERLALAVAEQNSCSYCLSAHTYLARNVAKLGEDDIDAARRAESAEPLADAALKLAAAITAAAVTSPMPTWRPRVPGGLDDAQIVEVLAHVALNILTNYFNKAVEVDIDFPVVSLHTHAA